MAKSKMYNGHKNKTHWNVSLWINNDPGFYNMAKEFIAVNNNKDIAAREMMSLLNEMGQNTTPDGYKFSKTSIRAAMVGM